MGLHYMEQGSGKPMVLLHGNGEDGSYFEKQIRYFSKNYHVYAVDTRGHGGSPRGTRPFTLKQFAADLKKFLDEQGLKHIILLGFSDGGNIALIFALRHPEYVEQLILNGANLNPFGMKFPVLAQTAAEYVWALWKSELSRRRAREWAPIRRRRERLGLMVKEPWIRPEDLREIRLPVLVIAGTRDMIREAHTKKIRRSIPGGRLKLIRGDHFIAAKNPRDFNRAVEHFLISTEKLEPGRKYGQKASGGLTES